MLPLIIAHRGASGVAQENSFAAFRAAQASQVDGVELDIHTSNDGQFIVHHDPEISGQRRIADINLPAIRRTLLPNGEPIPTLGEVLDLLPGLFVWIEVKHLPAVSDATFLNTLAKGPTPATYGRA